jgi:hypothetical protein
MVRVKAAGSISQPSLYRSVMRFPDHTGKITSPPSRKGKPAQHSWSAVRLVYSKKQARGQMPRARSLSSPKEGSNKKLNLLDLGSAPSRALPRFFHGLNNRDVLRRSWRRPRQAGRAISSAPARRGSPPKVIPPRRKCRRPSRLRQFTAPANVVHALSHSLAAKCEWFSPGQKWWWHGTKRQFFGGIADARLPVS